MIYPIFISCPKGLERLLADEISFLSDEITITKVIPQGVNIRANLADVYKICLWSRIANRVYLKLFSGKVDTEQSLYQLSYEFDWQSVFNSDRTLAIDFHGTSEVIRNSMFGAQVIKDGIVDYFRALKKDRPTIDKTNPQILLYAYLRHGQVTLSLDLTGYSLHQRGYRKETGAAPLKENVAAALLIRAHWPKLAQVGQSFCDPLCGSGTLVIEAALMAANIAPGLINTRANNFIYWNHHQPALWQTVRKEALDQRREVTNLMVGSDHQANLIKIARNNAKLAGIDHLVKFNHQSLSQTQAPAPLGLMVTNPPYGERLNETEELLPLYSQLGTILHDNYSNWQAAILSNDPQLVKNTGLRSHKQHVIMNGPLECQLFHFNLDSNNQLRNVSGSSNVNAQMLIDRLTKNYRHLRKWAQRNDIECYRLYDADLPQYAYAIDLYQDYAVLQEYKAPAYIAASKVEQRSRELIHAVSQVLAIDSSKLIIKQRQAQKGISQYQKMDHLQKTFIVHENNALFKINLTDYLDTGLFLDHRPLRKTFRSLPAYTRFLNCFCYTATASVQAALAGAMTTNIDLSNTYLNWAEENFVLNRLNPNFHQFIQTDCINWLENACEKFDVIFLDPPSFSNSKRMQSVLDIQKDHPLLIKHAMRLLTPQGKLYFSTNLHSFKLEASVFERYKVMDIGLKTIDIDFKRNPKIHHCFIIETLN